MTSAYLITAWAAVSVVIVICAAALKGWRGWLDLKARELDLLPRELEGMARSGTARIELADLKERVRKLEAIAAGVDL